MLASTWFDPVLGLDTHIVLVPTPAGPVPTPIPMPFVGMVFDPAGAAIGAAMGGGMTLVNGLPATNVGTAVTNKLTMPHIPAPGPFAKGVPGNDAELFFGGLNVKVGGTFGVRLGEIAMSCSDPVRMPTSVVLAIPKGPLVLIMRPPSPDLAALATSLGFRLGLKVIAKAAKAGMKLFRALRAAQKGSSKWKGLSRMLQVRGNGQPSRLRAAWNRTVCFLTGHPVDVATGRVLTGHTDLELNGPLPIRLARAYDSSLSRRDGPLGRGWSHTLDEAVWGERGRLVYRTADGRELELSTLELPDRVIRRGQSLYHPLERVTLRCVGDFAFELEDADGIVSTFAPVPGGSPRLARILERRAPDGHALRFSYDARGLLASVRCTATGRGVALEHDAGGRLRRATAVGTGGRETFVAATYDYDESGDLIAATDPLGKSWRFEYVTHLLVKETNRNGLSFYFQYDGLGSSAKCVRTWGDGGIYDHQIAYDENNRRTLVESSVGAITLYQMDEAGQVVAVTDAIGNVTRYEYDPRTGQKTKEIDPTGAERCWEYDDRGDCVKTVAPDGATLTFNRDARGLLVSARDAIGGEWRWGHDDKRRLLGHIDPMGRRFQYHWRDGRLVGLTDASGQHTRVTVDAGGDVTEMTLPNGSTGRWQYDAFGRLVASTDPKGNERRRELDAAGRTLTFQDVDGNVRRTEYDAEGNVTRARDRHHDVTFEYEGMGRLRARVQAGTRLELTYDAEERVTAIRNELGAVYRFERDAAGHLQSEHVFGGLRRRYLRDKAGRVVQIARPEGRTTKLQRDKAGRIVAVEHSDGTAVSYVYRADGALLEASNREVTVRFERDALGRVTCERQGDDWVRSSYGAFGARLRVESSRGAAVRIDRNAVGQTVAIEGALHALTPDGDLGQLLTLPFDARLRRDELGREIERTLPGGVQARWERDATGRPVTQEVWAGGVCVMARRHTWDVDGQLRELIDGVHGPVRFQHDPLGRLAAALYEDGSVDLRMPDAVGNLFKTADRSDRRYGPAGELLEARAADGSLTRYEYDPEGLLARKITGEGVWRYHWNGAGQLVKVVRPDGDEVRFTYDPLGRRTSKTFRGRTTRWLWDGNVPLHEWVEPARRDAPAVEPAREHERAADSANAAKREALLLPRPAQGPPSADDESGTPDAPITWLFEPETFAPIGKLIGHRRYGIVVDALGTPIAMYDDAGALVWSAALDVYGGVRASRGTRSACPFRWPGQYEDPETGLHYNRFRYYDPDAAQYLSQDPMGLQGGLALYQYVPDPLSRIDPFGLAGCEPTDAQVQHAVANVQGLTPEQARSIMSESFGKGSSVVFGGSRVRGNSHPGSDLDVGFGGLSKSQAGKLIDRQNKMAAADPSFIPLETTRIVPGNETPHIPRIESPEEFFARSGTRSDPGRVGEPFSPSGSITYNPDGSIVDNRIPGA